MIEETEVADQDLREGCLTELVNRGSSIAPRINECSVRVSKLLTRIQGPRPAEASSDITKMGAEPGGLQDLMEYNYKRIDTVMHMLETVIGEVEDNL